MLLHCNRQAIDAQWALLATQMASLILQTWRKAVFIDLSRLLSRVELSQHAKMRFDTLTISSFATSLF
jgi:hypothetical protein